MMGWMFGAAVAFIQMLAPAGTRTSMTSLVLQAKNGRPRRLSTRALVMDCPPLEEYLLLLGATCLYAMASGRTRVMRIQ